MRTGDFINLWRQVNYDAEYSLLVTGHSMRPFLLHETSVVYIRKWSRDYLKRGSIVLFLRENGSLVLHRVVNQYSDGRILMNGDAQCWSEEIDEDQIIAQVVRLCRTNRVISADNLLYRFLSQLWLAMLPIRPNIFRVLSKLKKGKKQLCGIKSKSI
ncbi:MAG: S24/S26 family peptidase [Lachnospiraceae bacterium]